MLCTHAKLERGYSRQLILVQDAAAAAVAAGGGGGGGAVAVEAVEAEA